MSVDMNFLFFSQEEKVEVYMKNNGVSNIIHHMVNLSNLCIMSKVSYDEGGYKISIRTSEDSRILMIDSKVAKDIITNCKSTYRFLNTNGVSVKLDDEF